MFIFDSLSLLFVVFIILGVIPNLFYMLGYLKHIERKSYFLINYFVFIISMVGVVVSNNMIVFLFFWEIMSLTSWQLILTNYSQKDIGKISIFYFIMTHLGFIFILTLFAIVSNGSIASTTMDSVGGFVANFPYPTLLFIFALVGFLSKAGVVPFHVWLPYAHPKAPSPVSALMSGVMLKVALYGFIRVLFDILYPWPLEWGIAILILGSLSSLIGVLYALSEHDIKALLANHSIENIGIILIGFGIGMIFDTLGLKALSSFAFIASFFHIFNHMSFKSLLFMGAGSILYETGTKNMEKYGGLIKNMPITALSFLLASISISALPPTNGFLSEWMIFQSLLNSDVISHLDLKLSIPFAIFSLALTGGLAIACFVKAYGISFLGLHRSENAKYAKEDNKLMKIGMILMSLVVISLMIFAPIYIKYFDKTIFEFTRLSIYKEIFPDNFYSLHAIGSFGGVVSPLILVLMLIFITFLIYIAQKIFNVKTRVCDSWACGYKTDSQTQYSAVGFAGPIRRLFNWLYKPDVKFRKITINQETASFDQSHFELHVKPLFEKTLYDSVSLFISRVSYYVYKIAHFEQTRYCAVILALLISVLFSYRVFIGEFSWISICLEIVIMSFIFKVLIVGEKR